MAGLIVLGVGLLLLMGQAVPDMGDSSPLIMGLVFLAGDDFEGLVRWWPLILVIGGALIITRALANRHT